MDPAAAVREVRDTVAALSLPLDLDGADAARRTRVELLAQIDDYLLPRLERADAPLLIVVGGSTGAGKSTITNTLVGSDVSPAGVLRPTTRAPVLISHPDDRAWFAGDGVLPDLARSTGTVPRDGAAVHLVVDDDIGPGFALLDAPDIDSVELANHDLAAQLLGAADVWLFVTTAARYADAVPWAYLERAAERAVGLAVVVNRVPPGARDEIADHLAAMLADHDLGDAQVIAIDEQPLDDGRLPAGAVAELTSWLDGLAADAEQRRAVVHRAVGGLIGSIPARAHRLATAVDTQAAAARALVAASALHHRSALEHIDAELDNGALLRGEVLDRWREHVGTGELMERLQRGIGRIRDRLASVVMGRRAPNDEVQGELESNLVVLIRHAADAAALATVEAWESLPGGAQILGDAPRGLDRAAAGLIDETHRQLDAWERYVFDLVRDQAGNRLAVARGLSLGINGVGVALMIAVFSSTGGLTGGEAGVAAGTAAVSQAVLTAVFGEQAVRTLTRRARDDLEARLAEVLDHQHERFTQLTALVPDPAHGAALTEAARVAVDAWTSS